MVHIFTEGGLSGGEIAGIVIGVLVAVLLVGVIVILIIRSGSSIMSAVKNLILEYFTLDRKISKRVKEREKSGEGRGKNSKIVKYFSLKTNKTEENKQTRDVILTNTNMSG